MSNVICSTFLSYGEILNRVPYLNERVLRDMVNAAPYHSGFPGITVHTTNATRVPMDRATFDRKIHFFSVSIRIVCKLRMRTCCPSMEDSVSQVSVFQSNRDRYIGFYSQLKGWRCLIPDYRKGNSKSPCRLTICHTLRDETQVHSMHLISSVLPGS